MGKREIEKDEIQPLKPELIETKSEVILKYGDCLVEIISDNDKGKQFVTSVLAAEKYFSDESKFKIIKKNQ